MPTANLNIVTTNRRMLTTKEAADYCGLPTKKFSMLCAVSPVDLGKGYSRYDLRDLDKWLDSLQSPEDLDDEVLLGRLG
jgi:hypothetical protein